MLLPIKFSCSSFSAHRTKIQPCPRVELELKTSSPSSNRVSFGASLVSLYFLKYIILLSIPQVQNTHPITLSILVDSWPNLTKLHHFAKKLPGLTYRSDLTVLHFHLFLSHQLKTFHELPQHTAPTVRSRKPRLALGCFSPILLSDTAKLRR